MFIRVVRGYRTLSYEAATILARFPPLDILAEMDSRVYNRIRILREDGESDPVKGLEVVKHQERQIAWETWRTRLSERSAHKPIVQAVLPVFENWMQRREGSLTYRLTQVLTGHGCFGVYLHRIGREATARCWHCEENQDSASHTLEECPAWASERLILAQRVGPDLSLPAILSAMLNEISNWRAVASFCETVMVKKEAAERSRDRTDPARRRRPRGPGAPRGGHR